MTYKIHFYFLAVGGANVINSDTNTVTCGYIFHVIIYLPQAMEAEASLIYKSSEKPSI